MKLCGMAIITFPVALLHAQTGDDILKKVDQNMSLENKITVSTMVIHGERGSRSLEVKSWQRGTRETFSEFLAPPREAGKKMLKLKDMLWTYTPSTDRTILISGHMLRQSLMGSDLSYEDMMEDPHLPNLYSATVTGEEPVNGRTCWVLELTARKEDVSYERRTVWADKERFVLLRENLYAKSGKLLKTLEVREVLLVDGRWLAKSALYKDVMKEGTGTEFVVNSITVNTTLPDFLFSKAALKK
jgi:outer membrane lipoprotein-sorting protein